MKILILNGLFLNTSLLVSEYLNSVYIQIEQLWPCSVASMNARLRSSVTTAPCLKECNAIQGPIQCHAMPFNVSIQCNTIQDPHSMQYNAIQGPHSMQYHSRSPFNAIPF